MTALTPQDLCRRWRISQRTLQRRCKEKQAPRSFRIGRLIRFDLDEVVAYERRGGIAPQALSETFDVQEPRS